MKYAIKKFISDMLAPIVIGQANESLKQSKRKKPKRNQCFKNVHNRAAMELDVVIAYVSSVKKSEMESATHAYLTHDRMHIIGVTNREQAIQYIINEAIHLQKTNGRHAINAIIAQNVLFNTFRS